jgi:hypothetical protein
VSSVYFLQFFCYTDAVAWELIRKLDENTGEYRAASGKEAVLYIPGNKMGKKPFTFAKAPEGAVAPWNSETGTATINKRWEDVREAAAQALMSHPDARTAKDGLRTMYEAQVELASTPEAGSAATGAAKFVVEGYAGKAEKKSILDQPAIAIEISNDGVAQIMANSVKKLTEEIVEGEFTEEE